MFKHPVAYILFSILLGSTMFYSVAGYAQTPAPASEETRETVIAVTPDSIEERLAADSCDQELVTVTLPESPISELDVVLMIDTSGSMGEVISQVQTNASQIVASIQDIVPDTAFALSTFIAYPTAEAPEMYPWRLNQDFTQDEARLQSALDSVTIIDGNAEESMLRALHEATMLDWRANSRRIVVLFGDEAPRDPDPGPDGTIGTADDLTQEQVLDALTEQHITVLPIFSGGVLEAIFMPDFYQVSSARTGGETFQLSRVEQVPEAIQELVEGAVARIQTLSLLDEAPGDGWIITDPVAHQNVEPDAPAPFTVQVCAPAGTEHGEYSFALNVVGDGVDLSTIPVLVRVPRPIPWWLLWILPLLFLLWMLYKLINRPKYKPAATDPLESPLNRPGQPDPSAPRGGGGETTKRHKRDGSSDSGGGGVSKKG
jgi:hypothetical protein